MRETFAVEIRKEDGEVVRVDSFRTAEQAWKWVAEQRNVFTLCTFVVRPPTTKEKHE